MIVRLLLLSWLASHLSVVVVLGFSQSQRFLLVRPSPSRQFLLLSTNNNNNKTKKKKKDVVVLNLSSSNKEDYDQGEVGKGPNWIEKSFPVETEEGVDVKKVDDYNLGISGAAFQTGPLSQRMYDAIMANTSMKIIDDGIREALTLCAMDFTAKEATRAALDQNGLEMVLLPEEEDQGMWGDMEAIRIYYDADDDEEEADSSSGSTAFYDSVEEAAKEWTPGQSFDFVVRQVPARLRPLSVGELMEALDSDGSIREEARNEKEEEKNDTNSEE